MRNLKVTHPVCLTHLAKRCGVALGLLLFLASQANAVVLIRDETIGFSVPTRFVDDNFQPSVLVQTGVYDLQIDPATNALIGRQRAGFVNYSTSQAISGTYDLETVLSSEGVVGSITSQAGNGTSSVSMTLSSLDILPGTFGSSLTATSGEFELVRFVAPTDRRVEVEASYQLAGEVEQSSLAGLARAYGVFYMVDLDSYSPDRIVDGVAYSLAESPIFDISVPGEIYVPQTFNAWTNRNYFVVSGAVLNIGLDLPFQSATSISLQASATSPDFFSADSGISIVRSTLASNPAAVSEPSLLALLGIGLVGLLRRRRAINLH